jgi:hypothetical protein
MNHRVCRCCGEPFTERGNGLSRNPNICASCSSLTDGMDESNVPACAALAPDETALAGMAEFLAPGELEDQTEELAAHRVPAGR